MIHGMLGYSVRCLFGNWRVVSSGQSVRSNIFLAWYMEYFEAEHHCLEFEVEQPWVLDILQVLVISEDGNEGLLVKSEDEVVKAEDKELALEEAMDSAQCLTLYRMVSRLCWGAELAPTEYCLPASWAAAWIWLWVRAALAMLLGQPESKSQFCPVCCKSCWEVWVETSHSFFTLFEDLIF